MNATKIDIFKVAEYGTLLEVEEMIKDWHVSSYAAIQLEIARNINSDAAMLQKIFQIGHNNYNDFLASVHQNCPKEFGSMLRQRIEDTNKIEQ